MSEPLTRLEIDRVAAGGDGVGRSEGMVVFVPRTAPGDLADVSLRASRRFARGRLVTIERASPDRVEPPCPHYVIDRCGGCQLQHLSYDAQLRAKRSIIGDSLRRIGRRAVDDPVVEPSDAQWRYRRKLTLHLRRVQGRWIAGLHPYDDPDAVFDLRDCPITDERVVAVFAAIRDAFAYLPRAAALRIAVQLTASGASAAVTGGERWAPDAFFDAVPSLTELWWKPEGGRPSRVRERSADAGAGASFIQVNAGVAARLHAHVLERARAWAPARVVDAYAGTGATAIPLATGGCTVVAIEWDRGAVASLRDRLAAPSSAVGGRVEEHLEAALPADVVLLNPPRTGVDPRVTDALERQVSPPRAVIYVSCDPATLARDLQRMPSYRVAGLRAFDMFPQTAHVETVCELVPEAA